MKQSKPRSFRIVAVPSASLPSVRGGNGGNQEMTPYETRKSAVAPYTSVTVDVPYGGSYTVTPEGKATYNPA